MTNTPTRSLGHRVALDGLRAVAVLVVILYHTWMRVFPGGVIGVDVFFVLSGFLITTVLLEEKAATERICLGRFYARRALRLLPALTVLVAVCSLYSALVPSAWTSAATLQHGITGSLFYVSSWMFASQVDMGMLTHTWSLSVEEQFYLLWPGVLMILLWWRGPWGALLASLGIINAVIALRCWMFFHGTVWVRLYAGFDTRADSLMMGCALALAVSLGLFDRVPRRLITAAGLIGMGGLAWVVLRVSTDPTLVAGGFTVVAMLAAAVLAGIVLQPSSMLCRMLEVRPLAAIGRISYGMYLWHFPILVVLYPPGSTAPAPLQLAVVLSLTLVTATLSYVFIEQPLLRVKRRLHLPQGSLPPQRQRTAVELPTTVPTLP